jgi:serine protease Do
MSAFIWSGCRPPFLSAGVTILTVVLCSVCVAQPSERAKKILDDKARVTSEQFWIYNDLPTAFSQAKETGKPILVVLRCLPCVECVKLDDEVVDRDPVIRPLLEQFVCVRVVSTNGLDLSLFQFDTDQSFAAFMLRDEKTIYGRFGTRSHQTEWVGDVSLPGLAEALKGALQLHAAWPSEQQSLQGKLGPEPAIKAPEQFPSLKEKYAYTSSIDYSGDVVRSCIHCHQIGDAIRDEYRRRQEAIPESLLYPYPHPKSIGMVLDPKTRGMIKAVEDGTPTAASGFMAGDSILRMKDQPILSMADIQWVLHSASPSGENIDVVIAREGKTIARSLTLEAGWRRRGDISWRASSWGLSRIATGGMRLETIPEEELKALGLPFEPMALRVRSVGQYGPHAAAKKAGFQKGDIITSIDGKNDFRSEADVVRYCVSEKVTGQIAIEYRRGKAKREAIIPLQK